MPQKVKIKWKEDHFRKSSHSGLVGEKEGNEGGDGRAYGGEMVRDRKQGNVYEEERRG